jgi:hypothetical protein
MAEPEITVEVTVPAEGETPTESPPETVVVIPPESTGTDPGTILSLEMLITQIGELRTAVDSLSETVSSVHSRIDHLFERIGALEIVEVDEPEETGEILTETIPAAAVEVVAETQPVARKRRFV